MNDLYRIGGKVVSRDKLVAALDVLLRDRERGATQAEAAQAGGVPRSFVSNLETLGEVRQGARVALVAFPVSNGQALKELAAHYSLDFVLTFSQDERTRAERANARDMFNRLLDTLAELNDYAAVIVCASGWRIETFKRVLEADIIGIELGASPLEHDVEVDLKHLSEILSSVIEEAKNGAPSHKDAQTGTKIYREWEQSKK